jgi:hypothetical protein
MKNFSLYCQIDSTGDLRKLSLSNTPNLYCTDDCPRRPADGCTLGGAAQCRVGVGGSTGAGRGLRLAEARHKVLMIAVADHAGRFMMT